MTEQSSNPILETLTLYREAVRRHGKFTAYNLSQPAGPDLGYDYMVSWASETDQAFVKHLKQLHARIDKLESEQTASKWISVKNRLPEDEEVVLIFAEQSGRFIATFHNAESYYGTDIFVVDGDDMAPAFHCDGLTHWMPLPKAPDLGGYDERS